MFRYGNYGDSHYIYPVLDTIMTCIVAISDGTTVYMGGERGWSDDHSIIPALEPKIFDKGLYLIGYAGNGGMGQNVVYNFEAPPLVTNTKIDKYMHTVFMPALKKFVKGDIKEEEETSFIIGIKGRVYEISLEDFQCTEYAEVAIGSGNSYALGSLYSTGPLENPYRITLAIEAAIQYSPTCSGPIDYLEK